MGLRHGLICIGCCWALMALLFVGGVMNLAWIAALSIVVAIEKLAPRGELLAAVLGLTLVAAGAWRFLSLVLVGRQASLMPGPELRHRTRPKSIFFRYEIQTHLRRRRPWPVPPPPTPPNL
jgi:hypothetical protein